MTTESVRHCKNCDKIRPVKQEVCDCKTSKLTPQELQEIREREQKATKGPWSCFANKLYFDGHKDLLEASDRKTAWIRRPEDAAFISQSREDIPKLLDHISSLESTLLRYEGTLKRIANGETYCDVGLPCEEVAREALSALPQDHV